MRRHADLPKVVSQPKGSAFFGAAPEWAIGDNRSPTQEMNMRFAISLLLMLFALTPCGLKSAFPVLVNDEWSEAVNGLQARLELVEREKINGTRWLVPHLELRSVRDLGNQMEVNCDNRHLKIELVDANDSPVGTGWSLPRSGPTQELNVIVLPWDSSIRLNLECRNWGVPKDAAAMVAADSGAWVIQEKEKGKIYLRATLTGEKTESSYDSWKRWSGKIQTPPLKVDWK
jgi:hypothetical protein